MIASVLEAKRAAMRLEHREAARLLAETLEEEHSDADRAEILLALGDARWRSGNLPAACEAGWEAFGIAQAQNDPALAARAALLLAAPHEMGLSDEPVIAALKEAAGGLSDAPELRARVHSRLAAALHAAGREQEGAAELGVALDLLDTATVDDSARAFVLRARQWLLSSPDSQMERRAAADELVDVATASGDPEQMVWAHGWRVSALLHMGEVHEAAAESARVRRLAMRLREPFHESSAAMWESPLAALRGDFAAAEAYARRAWTREIKLGFEEFMLAVQLFEPLWHQGRLPELRPTLERLLTLDEPAWHAMVPLARLQDGDRIGAEDLFRSLVSGLEAIPRDFYWPFAVGLLAATCVELEDRESAAHLYEALLPFVGRLCDAAGFATCGPVDLHLARLAALTGASEAAERHRVDALTWARQAGARPYEGLAASNESIPWHVLTPGELRVAALVADGLTNAQIADKLVVSRYTVETHVKRVFAKLDMTSRSQLASAFTRRIT